MTMRGRPAVCAAFIVLAACGGGGPDRTGIARRPADSLEPGAATAVPAAAEPPATIAAVTADGRVVLLSPDGTERRELFASRAPAGFDSGVSLAPDAKTVWFTTAAEGGARDVRRVPAAGGTAETVARGAWPDVSPDGRSLAYAVGSKDAQRTDTIVVRDLATTRERRWTLEERSDQDPFSVVQDLGWDGSSRRLAFTVVGEEGSHVRLLDTSRAEGSLWDARLPATPERRGSGAWAGLTRRGAALAVVEYCCAPNFNVWRVLEVDRLFDVVATVLETNVPTYAIDYDTQGTQLVYLSREGPSGGVLYRWTGEATKIAVGIVAADW